VAIWIQVVDRTYVRYALAMTVPLDALAAFASEVAGHEQIVVAVGGVLPEPRDGHAAGTPYVTVTVPTVAAAELAARRLAPIARLDGGAWEGGWRLVDGAALAIDVYPEAEGAMGG
jgi:hypothetical protein